MKFTAWQPDTIPPHEVDAYIETLGSQQAKDDFVAAFCRHHAGRLVVEMTAKYGEKARAPIAIMAAARATGCRAATPGELHNLIRMCKELFDSGAHEAYYDKKMKGTPQ